MTRSGLHCLGCGHKLITKETRGTRAGIRRRKECYKCGLRITTLETAVNRVPAGAIGEQEKTATE